MSVGKIVANVVANTGPFQEGLKAAGKDAKKFAGHIGKGIGAMAKMTAAAGLAGVALTTALVVKGLAAVDVQAKLARTVGGTQRGLVGLERAAADAGVAQGAAGKDAQSLNRALGDAISKGGKATGALKRLGLTAESLAAQDVDERFASIADAMVGADLGAAQMAGTLGELGIKSKEMVGLMQGGGDVIRATTIEMDKYGVTLSEIETAQIEALNDAMDRGGEVMKGVSVQLASKLAPLIHGVVELFSDASGETKGFGDIMDKVISAAISGIGWLADRLAAFRIGALAIGIAFQSIGTTIIGVAASVATGWGDTIQTITEKINVLIRGANLLPGIELPEIEIGESKAIKVIEKMAEMAEAELAASKARLAELANEPLPSEALDQWVSDVRTKSREAAEETVAARTEQKTRELRALTDGQTREELARAKAAAKETAARQAKAETHLASLQAFLRTELEAEAFAHQEKLAQFETSAAELGLVEEEQRAIREGLEQSHQDRLNEIKKKGLTEAEKFTKSSWQNQTSTVIGELGGLLQGVKSNSRAMFNVQKIGAIAQAIVSTYAGAAKALAAYPPPLSFAMAGAQVAAGLANVAAIKSQTFGGGGGGPAPSAGAAGAAAAAGAAGGGGGGSQDTLGIPSINPTDLFSGQVVSDVVEKIVEFGRQGGNIEFA